MASISKRMQTIQTRLTPGKVYSFLDAMALLKQLPPAKFRESVDVSIMLGVDPRKSEQAVRGASVLPHGIGKTVHVAVFTQGANATAATSAGADRVGMDDLAQEMQEGQINYDVVIATPDAMGVVGRLGTLLGPKGLMPNPKVGTVTMDVATAVRNAKGGQVRFRTDKNGIIHCSIGKIDFDNQALKENLATLLSELRKVKPATAKGIYIKKVTLSTTMGPGLVVDEASVNV